MQLKNYQQESLGRLQSYLAATRICTPDKAGNIEAYNNIQNQRFGGTHYPRFQPLEGLEHVPYVCLRLPTGGGKTLLCAHSIGLAAQSLWDAAYPLTLWLVPSTTIKQQTLETLQQPGHANFQALQAAFDNQFRIFDIDDFANIRPHDIAGNACIILSTFASLRVEKTEGRRAYDHHEELESHFERISNPNAALERDEQGQIKYSFANLLHLHRPLVLVDEAHNAKSDLSIEVLRRIQLRAVIEYTATPAKNSNVIQSVSAAQLKAEHMIKLPIIFSQELDWKIAVSKSIETRAALEQTAKRDSEYIRPLVLFQAENKDGAITVEVLRQFLLEQENIPPDQIAIATGEQRELDGIDLFNPHCPVRFVITVQALKEGWDCSFAYVLCSVANTRSSTAVEQLLGRVLRMPYASPRSQTALNRAYAHVSAQSWQHAASQLTDRLISMGFEKQEIENVIYEQPELDLENFPTTPPPINIILTEKPDLSSLDVLERAQVHVEETATGWHMQVHEPDAALSEKISQLLPHAKDRREWQLRTTQRQRKPSPSECKTAFTVPQLCLQLEDKITLLEKEECLTQLGMDGFDPLHNYQPLSVEDFRINETLQIFEADIQGEKIAIAHRPLSEVQPTLPGITSHISAMDLATNIARNLYKDLAAGHMPNGAFFAYIHKTIQDLLQRADITLEKLVRGRFLLEKIIHERLQRARQKTHQNALQQLLLLDGPHASRLTIDLQNHAFSFPENYPASTLYQGRLRYQKHYYPQIAAMNQEEEQCAVALDKHEQVQHWVRNLERQLEHAFSLPTSSDWFYPDFVAQLHDGRILVVEYKGEHLKGSDDSKEKEMVGIAWAKISGNLFHLAVKKDDQGRDVTAQLRQVLAA